MFHKDKAGQHARLVNIHAVDVNEGKSLKLTPSYE
jgi:hypothetical protein